MNVHCMIDLETFGTAKTSCITQLAATLFDPRDNFRIYNCFNVPISPESCRDAGLTFDLDTVIWWLNQSKEAQQAVFFTGRQPLTLKAALEEFQKWLPSEAKVWGNGASFDLPILENGYRALKLRTPWKHWNERCYRTFNAQVSKDDPARPAREGVHHNALDDCRYQVAQLQYVCGKLGIQELL